jgi:protein TonB
MTSPTTLAFQPKAGLRFITILMLVTLAHVLVIVLLLAHFGWLNGVGTEMDDNAAQSGIVIPVTLETEGDEENKSESAPAAQEPTQEQTPTSPETSPSSEQQAETPADTTADVEKEIPLAIEPEAKPAVTPPVPQPLTEPAPVSPPLTAPQTTAPVLPSTVTKETVKDGSSGRSSHATLTANDSLATTPAQVDPNYLHRPNPVYPNVSKRLREAGTVLLRVSLDAAGEVRDVNVQTTSAYQRLDQAAMDAVRQWRFIPASRGQQPVASTVLVPIEFKHQ